MTGLSFIALHYRVGHYTLYGVYLLISICITSSLEHTSWCIPSVYTERQNASQHHASPLYIPTFHTAQHDWEGQDKTLTVAN